VTQGDRDAGGARLGVSPRPLQDIKSTNPKLYESGDKILAFTNAGSHGRQQDIEKILDVLELVEIELRSSSDAKRRSTLIQGL
jgi:hypothetical protein